MLCPFKMANPNLKSWGCEYDRCAWYIYYGGLRGSCAIMEIAIRIKKD